MNHLGNEATTFDFKSIRKKFENLSLDGKSPTKISKEIPISTKLLQSNSLENLNNSTDQESTDESERTVLELDKNPNDDENNKKYYIINNSKYTPIKSCSVSNIFSYNDNDFVKYDMSIRNEISKILTKSEEFLDNDQFSTPSSNTNNLYKSNGISKSEEEILNEISFSDKSQSNNGSSYLEPIASDDLIPFPFPRIDDLTHSYSNDTNDNNLQIDKCTKSNQYDLLVELIKKEKEYIEVFNFFYDEYYLRLIDTKFITLLQKKKIFTGINDMYNFHTKFWLPDLEARASNWKSFPPIICDLFLKHSAQIARYEFYVDSLKSCLDSLDFYCDTKPLFRSQLERIDQNVRPAFIKLAAKAKLNTATLSMIKSLFFYLQTWPVFTNTFLIKYENFLTIDHPDQLNFESSIKFFNDLATKSHETIEDIKQFEILQDLQNRLGTKYNILDRKRVLIKEGPVVTLSPHLGNVIKIYIVLLNDLLIICEQAESEFEQLKPKRPLDTIGILVSSDINAFTEDSTKNKLSNTSKRSGIDPAKGFSLHVPCVQKVFKFYARNAQEKKRWLSVFMNVAQANRFEDEIDRSSVGSKCPKLIPEKMIQYCCKCKSEFSVLSRKHNCKACGFIFCKYCSRMQATLEYDETRKPSRVCDFCYDQLFNKFRSNPPTLQQIDQKMKENLSKK